MLQTAPDRFNAADVAAGLVHLDLIPICVRNVEDCHIRALVDVLADIVDAIHRVRKLDIDVGLESAGEKGAIWDYPPVVYLHLLKPATPGPCLDLCSEASVLWLPAPLQGYPSWLVCLLEKLPWEPLGVLAIVHAWGVRVESAAGTMDHLGFDDFKEL